MAFGTVRPVTSAITIGASATRVSSIENRIQTSQVQYQAPYGNSGTLYIGDSSVNPTTQLGIPLKPGDAVGFEGMKFYGTIDNNLDLSRIYIHSTQPTDKVVVTYFIATNQPGS